MPEGRLQRTRESYREPDSLLCPRWLQREVEKALTAGADALNRQQWPPTGALTEEAWRARVWLGPDRCEPITLKMD